MRFFFQKKIITKMTKFSKFFDFQSFYAIFVKFSTDFVDWNVEESQQGTSLLSLSLFSLFEDIMEVCKLKKSQIGTEFDKKPKIFQFSKFLCNFCQNFDRLRGLEC